MSTNEQALPPLKPFIRQARPADADVIAEFNMLLARETEQRILDADRVRKGVAALLADPAKGRYHIAENDGQVIGQLLITREWSDWRNGWFWWIQSLFVREDFRGRKVFRALFEHVKQEALKQPDVCGVRLYVDADNERARTHYERFGMTLTSYRLYETEFVPRVDSDSSQSKPA